MNLRLAFSKGRILEDTLPLLAKLGLTLEEDPETSRKLLIATNQAHIEIVMVRASDVPTYVRSGAADMGVVGLDVLREYQEAEGSSDVLLPIDLKFASCRLCVAAPQDFAYEQAVKQGSRLSVATKYLHLARRHFAQKGVHVDLIKLYGSMELAPALGIAHLIVDLVSSGNTLRANRLVEVEHIMDSTAHMLVNEASFYAKRPLIAPFIEQIRLAIAA